MFLDKRSDIEIMSSVIVTLGENSSVVGISIDGVTFTISSSSPSHQATTESVCNTEPLIILTSEEYSDEDVLLEQIQSTLDKYSQDKLVNIKQIRELCTEIIDRDYDRALYLIMTHKKVELSIKPILLRIVLKRGKKNLIHIFVKIRERTIKHPEHSSFWTSILKDDCIKLEEIMTQNEDFIYKTLLYTFTALSVAAILGSDKCARLLLEICDSPKMILSIMSIYAKTGNKVMVKFILDGQAVRSDDLDKIITTASKCGNRDVVKLISNHYSYM